MPSTSVSGISNGDGPLPGTTKNLHLVTLSLCLNLTVQITNYSMFELLYIFNTALLFFVVCNYSIVDLGNKFLNILNGIKLSSAPVLTLHFMQVCLWLVLDSSLVNNMDFTLSRVICFTLTTCRHQSHLSYSSTYRSLSWVMSCIVFPPCQSY